MTKKLMKTYTYEGLGFPIELNNVETILAIQTVSHRRKVLGRERRAYEFPRVHRGEE